MSKKSNSTPHGGLNEGMTERRPASQSTNAESPSMSGTLATTPSPKKASQRTVNLQDIPNAVRLIQALAAGKALGKFVFWKKLALGNGEEVIALCFPVRNWEVSSGGELKLKKTALGEGDS